MSSFCDSALASLDDSLTLLEESLGKLKAAKPIDLTQVIEHLKMASESAHTVREMVGTELPDASWQSRKELDELIEHIQEILDARTLQQQRSRLLALAHELEVGRIVHRRARRLSELNQLRDRAVDELRFLAGSEGTPPTVPGPQAEQWLRWACGLQEPQDSESLKMIRDGFERLDDFVINLELSMWTAGKSPTTEIPAGPQRLAEKTPPPRMQMKGFDESPAWSGRKPAASAGINSTDQEVANLKLAKNGSLKPREAAGETHVAHSEAPDLGNALATLDKIVAALFESLGKLKAAQSVALPEVTERFKMAAESARMVRGLVGSELPAASWQSRKELDALVEEIHKIQAARTLEQHRSRLLALATELERGHIVHRRAHRVDELNLLREQAIDELRSHAAPEEAPPTLPGPPAYRWIEWACGLQEPQDSESLKTLREGFERLDDFVANLEFSMWVAGESPTGKAPPPPPTPSGETLTKPPRIEIAEFEEPVPRFRAESSSARDEAPGLEFRHEPSQGLESNTLTPHDGTPPRTEADRERIHAQESALVAGMMGRVADPVGHFDATVEHPATAAVLDETETASTQPADNQNGDTDAPVGVLLPPVVPPKKRFAPARLIRDRVIQFRSSVERPFAGEGLRESAAGPAGFARGQFGYFRSFGKTPVTPEGFHEPRTTPAFFSWMGSKVEEQWAENRQLMLASAAVLVVALGVLLWWLIPYVTGNDWGERASARSAVPADSAALASGAKTQITEAPKPQDQSVAPGLTPGNPAGNGQAQPAASTPTTAPATSTDSAHAPNAKAPTKEETKPKEEAKAKDQSAAAKPPAKTPPATQASDNAASKVPQSAPSNTASPKQQEAAANVAALRDPGPPPVLPAGAPSSVPNIVSDAPAAVPKLAAQKIRVSSGGAQGLLIHQVTPKYPPQARQAHIEGTVVLQAVIGKDGSVQNLQVVSGPRMLTQAAMDAVKQWRYKPSYLNGEPVEADTQINVNFKLGE